MKNYQPISCDFYDELTLRAVRHSLCSIIYKNSEGKDVNIKTVIQDIITRNKEEYLLLFNGTEIRLDFLVSVDGKKLSSYC